jgi:SanA protein
MSRRILFLTVLRISVVLLVVLVGLVLYANLRIVLYGRRFLYQRAESVPVNRVGLILGTSRYLRGGAPNPYFRYRIDSAVELYETGKVEFLIASGDNSRAWYNEPVGMREDLLARGVPPEAIYLDYAGFRTLDSVVRSNRIFQQSAITIISQEFHNLRAVYIARHFGIDAVGFNAPDVQGLAGLRTRLREYFARVKAIIDVHITRTQPKFLGEAIRIP